MFSCELLLSPLQITDPEVLNPQACLPPAWMSAIDEFSNSDWSDWAKLPSSPQQETRLLLCRTPQENPNPDEITRKLGFRFGIWANATSLPLQQIAFESVLFVNAQIWESPIERDVNGDEKLL